MPQMASEISASSESLASAVAKAKEARCVFHNVLLYSYGSLRQPQCRAFWFGCQASAATSNGFARRLEPNVYASFM